MVMYVFSTGKELPRTMHRRIIAHGTDKEEHACVRADLLDFVGADIIGAKPTHRSAVLGRITRQKVQVEREEGVPPPVLPVPAGPASAWQLRPSVSRAD